MIKKINVGKFGLFNNYNWDNSLGNDLSFKQLNIIYGRNYSGKTTLARIFRCVEKGELHKHYIDGNFSLTCENGNIITQNNFLEFAKENQIRVYNTDFVNENLSWLHDENGLIQPFTILGSKNVNLENEIKTIDEKLGNIEQKKGLLYEQFQIENSYNEKQREFNQKSNDLEGKLKSQANDKIKIDTNLFLSSTTKKTYITNDIKADISKVQNDLEKYILSNENKDEKRKLLSENSLPAIDKIHETKTSFEKHYSLVKEILNKEIKPTKPIEDLINDNLLQTWVRQGIDKHKDKRETCGFCGGILPKDLWDKLDAHFSKESEELRINIQSQIDSLEKAKLSLIDFLKFKKESFYSNLHSKFEELLERRNTIIKNYSNNIDFLIKDLKEREQDIFKTRVPKEIKDVSQELIDLAREYDLLIEQNNLKAKTLLKDQQNNRYELRLSEVAQFIKNIDYEKRQEEILKLEKETLEFFEDKRWKESEINEIKEEKRKKEAEAKDESKGALLINQHLSNYFGHDELMLVAHEVNDEFSNGKKIRFKITRDGNDAKNLSEGECSLISFCYFIAKMEDEMKDTFNKSNLIIYIDDPISSLDNNHIFFMYSLIESVIAKPKNYGQLFISTHNLDFLKYLKRLSPPSRNESVNYFLIERQSKKNDKSCFILPLPKHIKNYVTEFNYLFNEIYKVYKEVKGDRKTMLENTYNQFYNLPNNLRKFLECYLFYKYPNNENPLENLGKLFDNNIPSLINRVVNEYSHLTYIDRGWKPIDVDEAEECAKIIIDKIREIDPEQFNALLESINQKSETINEVVPA
jgi:wobble nucleotide-excising tRNase